jgi:hypothetical protein
MNRKELEQAIEEKKAEIENFELDPDDYEEQYCECLDESGDVNICGLKFAPSYALRKLDPTAYHCGLLDYIDGLDKDDDPKYQELEKELEELEEQLDELN